MKLSSLLFLQASVLLVFGDSDGCDMGTSGSGGGLIDLHIIGFFPCTHQGDKREIPVDNCDDIDRIPIMKLALEEINERCDLLPGYQLVVDYANSGVSDITTSLHKFIVFYMSVYVMFCCSVHQFHQYTISSNKPTRERQLN